MTVFKLVSAMILEIKARPLLPARLEGCDLVCGTLQVSVNIHMYVL